MLPVVLEKAGAVGGLARTESHDGYRFDIGGHRFFTRIGEIDRLWRRMLGEDLLKVQRLSRIYYQGRFFDYPLNLTGTLRRLGAAESSLILLSYLKAKLFPHRPEETFEHWVTNRFGSRLYRRFFQAYTEKVWGMPCELIQADWAAQRIGGLSVMQALIHPFRGGNGPATLTKEFLYPVLGPGMMWERFAQAVTAGGGRVELGADVTRLEHAGGRVTKVAVCKDGAVSEISARHFISSMPLADLIARLCPPPPQAVGSAAGRLKYRAFIMVALLYNRQELFPDHWVYVHTPSLKVARVQNFKRWSRAMVADPAKTCLGAEYFCDEGDSLWNSSDESLVALARGELDELGLAGWQDFEHGIVIRQAKAYPVYDRDYRPSLATIRQYLAGFENLQVVGRNGMHRYNNQDHSMLTGLLAARNILGGGGPQAGILRLGSPRYDLWSLNSDGVVDTAAAPPTAGRDR